MRIVGVVAAAVGLWLAACSGPAILNPHPLPPERVTARAVERAMRSVAPAAAAAAEAPPVASRAEASSSGSMQQRAATRRRPASTPGGAPPEADAAAVDAVRLIDSAPTAALDAGDAAPGDASLDAPAD